MQSAIIRVMDQRSDWDAIFVFATIRLKISVLPTLAKLTITRITHSLTRDLGRDFTAGQKAFNYSRLLSGKCGRLNCNIILETLEWEVWQIELQELDT